MQQQMDQRFVGLIFSCFNQEGEVRISNQKKNQKKEERGYECVSIPILFIKHRI